jgi:hypothetical protein
VARQKLPPPRHKTIAESIRQVQSSEFPRLKCARGECHPLRVLTVGYPGGKTRQVSVRSEQVPQVRKAIDGYHDFKWTLEAISELNHRWLIADAVEDLWEPWMRHAYQALDYDVLLLIIQQELAKWCQKSKTRGRKATPAEIVLRMLLLKHVRDWSYEVLTREVRANLVYREATRIGGEAGKEFE